MLLVYGKLGLAFQANQRNLTKRSNIIMDKEMLEKLYNELLTIFGDYHPLCITMDSCKDCPLEEVCKPLVEAASHLTVIMEL